MTRILIVSSRPLFGQGLECLLREQGHLDVLAVEARPQMLVERIEQLRPDVVLLDCGDEGCSAAPALSEFLRAKRAVRLIGLNLQDNCICIYTGEQRQVTAVADLVEAVKPSPAQAAAFDEIEATT